MVSKFKLFLASSYEFADDRATAHALIGRENKEWVPSGVFLEPLLWEDFVDVLSKTRLQDEYENAIRNNTEEEFQTAVGQFQATEKPFVPVYFKTAPKPQGTHQRRGLAGPGDFEDKLKALGDHKTARNTVDRLMAHLRGQLDKLAAQGFIAFHSKQAALRRPFQVPSSDAEHVSQAEIQALKHIPLIERGRLRRVTVSLHVFGGAGKTSLARVLCACRDARPLPRRIATDSREQEPVRPARVNRGLGRGSHAQQRWMPELAGARAQLQEALSGCRIPVVIDGVWVEAQLLECGVHHLARNHSRRCRCPRQSSRAFSDGQPINDFIFLGCPPTAASSRRQIEAIPRDGAGPRTRLSRNLD